MIEVTNTAPYFNVTPPIDQSFRFNQSGGHIITLPPFVDDENHPIFIVIDTPTNVLGVVQVVYPNKLNITTWKWMHVGSYTINVTLTDTQKSNSYQFILTIFNDAPFF